MSINVEISSIFGRYTNNKLNFKVEGKTIGECLNDLGRQFPDLKRVLLNKAGKLIHGYNVYVNGESTTYPPDMKLPVNDGDKLNVVYVIQGG
jgi:molybdopterin converting factor small subunit